MKTCWKVVLVSLLLLLAGCKTDLYSGLSEAEANQMMALLIYHNIPVEKEPAKEGVKLLVDKSRFVDAVEVLRQNGLPRRKTVSMEDLFPSGQLVSSPEQESAKLIYLKGQQLEKMLNSMDGVIAAEVSVAVPRPTDDGQRPPTSAAVFIKYSPEVNLAARESEIRNLIRNAIPSLPPERISLSMQRAEFRYMPTDTALAPKHNYWPFIAAISAGGLLIAGFAAGLLFKRKKPAIA